MLCILYIYSFIFFASNVVSAEQNFEEEKYGVKYASPCEVCKLVTKEISEQLNAKESSGVIETGYNIDNAKKKTKYNNSELRLVEVLESVCEGMKDYKVHKERTDSTRWAKMMSQTFKTLHGLVNKGVKVELGIPYELWDEPSAEITHLKTQCEQFIEEEEDRISEWYYGSSSPGLSEWLCPAVIDNITCLSEPYGEDVSSEQSQDNRDEL